MLDKYIVHHNFLGHWTTTKEYPTLKEALETAHRFFNPTKTNPNNKWKIERRTSEIVEESDDNKPGTGPAYNKYGITYVEE